MTGRRPSRSAIRALLEATALVGKGTYHLGATDNNAALGIFDCNSFAVRYCFGLPGHRPGYNRGWSADAAFPDGASVVDDINSNSLIEDAYHRQDLAFIPAGEPQTGDLLAYPTIHLPGSGAGPWIGHVAIVASCARARAWNPMEPDYSLLDIIECVGPNGNHPAIRRSNGGVFDHHSLIWSKPQHMSRLLRIIP